jgi:hypothetical protein
LVAEEEYLEGLVYHLVLNRHRWAGPYHFFARMSR